MLRRLLVGVSGTPALEAKIAYTLDFCRQHPGASVQLVSIVDVERLAEIGPVPLGAGHFANRIKRERTRESHEKDDKALKQFAERLRSEGIECQIVRDEGDPITILASLWRYVDLVILAARGWFDHGVLPDPETALGQLIASGVRPILAVPETHTPIARVMIAYNGSLEASKALKHFVHLNLFGSGVDIDLVCVGNSKTEENVTELLEDATDYLKAHDMRVRPLALDGDDSVRTLLNHATSNHIDLVVMGGSYQRVLLARRFGRVTLSMIRQASVPLFISN